MKRLMVLAALAAATTLATPDTAKAQFRSRGFSISLGQGVGFSYGRSNGFGGFNRGFNRGFGVSPVINRGFYSRNVGVYSAPVYRAPVYRAPVYGGSFYSRPVYGRGGYCR